MSNKRGKDGESTFAPAWAHNNGLLELDAEPEYGEVDNAFLLDRSLIKERLIRYCWYYDERRATALGDCFTEDAVWEGDVTGEIKIGPFIGREKIVAWLTEFWPHQRDQRRHMIMNTIIQSQQNDRAETCSYILLCSANEERAKLETTGFYRLQLVKNSGKWQIQHLSSGFDYPFWPKPLAELSEKGKTRHGINTETL